MANIPDINFNKIPNKSAKFNQAEFYEENFEKVNEQIVPKINEMDTKINVEISAQLEETGNRIDNIIATPIDLPEIYVEEIHDARQGKGSVGANISEIKNKLAQNEEETLKALQSPRLQINYTGAKYGVRNTAGATDFYTFSNVYHVFDVGAKNTGAVYAIGSPFTNKTVQEIFRSLDGGENWIKLGDISVNLAAGERLSQIFVEPFFETFYFMKAVNVNIAPVTHLIESYSLSAGVFTKLGTLDIGIKYWHASSHNIDARPNVSYSQRIVMFAEYGPDQADEFYVWKTVDRGVTWQKMFTQTGNNGASGTGQIRHFHTLQADPYTNDWWLGSGDLDGQCKIWKSSDEGVTWQKMFGDNQEARTLGFVFEQDAIYYGMDSPQYPQSPSQIFKINRTTMAITSLGYTFNGLAVYGLTKTFFPQGFLIWTVYEKNASKVDDKIIIEFYDYHYEKILPVGMLSLKGLIDENTGVPDASRYQDKLTGNIFGMMTPNLLNKKYGMNATSSANSQIFKSNLVF